MALSKNTPTDDTIQSNNALIFTIKKPNGKMRKYIMIFNVKLDSKVPFFKEIISTIYRVSNKKNPTYTKIASRKFNVLQIKNNSDINNEMFNNYYNNLKLPTYEKLKQFINENGLINEADGLISQLVEFNSATLDTPSEFQRFNA